MLAFVDGSFWLVVIHLFSVGVGLNIVWEFLHAWLYETCRRQTWQQNVPLLLIMAVKDGGFIVFFYSLSVVLFGRVEIVRSVWQLLFFFVLALSFSFVDERVSLRLKRWEYATSMPRVFGVGVTPLLEIAVTGLLAFWIVF